MLKITPKKLIKEGFKRTFQIIDIREKYELEDGSIFTSINIPMGEILENINLLSKTDDIIIYCNTGRRSKSVVHMLNKLHNISTYNLEGGYKNFLKNFAK